MKQTCGRYCDASTQSIKLRKSVIYFGKEIDAKIQRWVMRCLGIRIGSISFKYLGIFVDGKRFFFNILMIWWSEFSWNLVAGSVFFCPTCCSQGFASISLDYRDLCLLIVGAQKSILNSLNKDFLPFLCGKSDRSHVMLLVTWKKIFRGRTWCLALRGATKGLSF